MYRAYRLDHKNTYRIRYGWRISRHGYHMVHHEQRAVIHLIYSLRQHGCKLQAICNYLNSCNMKTSREGRWHPATVKKIIDENSGIVKTQ